MPEIDSPDLVIKLDSGEASTVASILLRLAALVDPDDPDGLVDAWGRRNPTLEELALTDDQLMLLSPVLAYQSNDRPDLASQLRIISAKIEGQLPDDAPAILHRP
jgi:hypothetical protein